MKTPIFLLATCISLFSSNLATAAQQVFCPQVAAFNNGTVCPPGWDCQNTIPKNNYNFIDAFIRAIPGNYKLTCDYMASGMPDAHIEWGEVENPIKPATPSNWLIRNGGPGTYFALCDTTTANCSVLIGE